MNKTPIEVLQEARDLIALRGKADRVFYDYEKDCYCSLGAIYKAAGLIDYRESYGGPYVPAARFPAYTAETFFQRVAGMPPETYNDNHSKEEVIAKFNEAIALAESGESNE
jgi:hypothetical protein